MKTISKILSQLEEARHQRYIAIAKCNVLASEHHLQTIHRLTEELSRTRSVYLRNRLHQYIGAGI